MSMCLLISDMKLITFFIFLAILKMGNGKSLQYFSNEKMVWKNIYGAEHLINEYVTLLNDPKANLPNSFTVCTSILSKYKTTAVAFFEMYKEDGTHWFLLQVGTTKRDYKNPSETVTIWYENPTTGSHGQEDFEDATIPIVPHSWYHLCMGLDTESGLLRIVFNGVEVVNEEKDYFKNTTEWKPRSVNGKILQFKGKMGLGWYQHRATFSNLNIFSTMMSVISMVERSSGGDSCSSPGDYLRYTVKYRK